MNWPGDQRSSENLPFISTHCTEDPGLQRIPRFTTQLSNDCTNLASLGRWVQGNYPTYTQQSQNVGFEGCAMEQAPVQSANQRVGCIQQHTVLEVSEFDTGYGTGEHEYKRWIPVPNSPRWQEGNSQYKQPFPNCVPQQPEAGANTPSCYENSNELSTESIANFPLPAQDGPWSAYNAIGSSEDTRHAKQVQAVAEDASDATHSMFACADQDPVYYMTLGHLPSTVEPSASSSRMYIPVSFNGASFESLPNVDQASRSELSSQYGHPNNTNRCSTLMKAGRHRNKYLHPAQSSRLAPSMQRRVSPASSLATEATSSSAVSDHTAKVLKCPLASCDAKFSGKYRKGNRRRHEKVYHSNGKPILCENSDCNKTFSRSDARLKHHRKCHPGWCRS